MGLLNKSGIGNGTTIQASHVTNIYDALNGTGSYNVIATGSFSGTFDGSFVGTASTSSYAISSSTATTSNTASYVNTLMQNVDISGSIRLQQTNKPTISSTSAYFYVSKSNDSGDSNGYDLYYNHNGNEFNFGWYESKLDTGIKWGGVVTYSGSTIYVTPGCGIIANHNASTTVNGNTDVTTVNWGAITASATYLTTSQVSYLLIDQNGSLLQHTSPFTPQEYNEKFPLGYIFSLTTSSIASFSDARVTVYGNDEQQYQFIRSFGPLKIKGFDITAQTGTLKLTIAGGRTYRAGGFYSQNPDEPSIYDSSTIATGSLIRVYRDPAAVGGFKAAFSSSGAPYTDIDPTKYDDGTGTLASVGSSEWTIQRLFQGPVNGLTYVYYGQNKYASLDAAVQNLSTDSFSESDSTIVALPFIGYVVCRGNATSLTDTTNNRIINAGLYRNTAGSSGGGGASATNLDSLSDVAITSAANGQTIIYDAGNWVNKNIFPYTGSAIISGSLTVTGSVSATGFTGSLFGTAQTASYVVTAATASFITTAQTASYVLNAVSASRSITSSFAITASHAITASYIAASSLQQNISITGSLNVSGSGLQISSSIVVTLPSGSSTQQYGVALFKYKQFSYNTNQAKIYEDDYIRLSYGTSGADPRVYVLQNPATGRMQCVTFSTKFPSSTVAIDGINSLALTDIWPNGIGSDEVLTSYITAGLDPTYPYYIVTWYRTNTTYGGNISCVVHRYATNI